MLIIIFQLLVLITSSAMALSPRDAIHGNDIDRYDSFMAQLESALDHFLDMHMENSIIIIDVIQHPTNVTTRSEKFTPSAVAQGYFDQEKKMADEIFGPNPKEGGHLTERDGCGIAGPGPRPGKRSESLDNVKRVSNCSQFCGSTAHCRLQHSLRASTPESLPRVSSIARCLIKPCATSIIGILTTARARIDNPVRMIKFAVAQRIDRFSAPGVKYENRYSPLLDRRICLCRANSVDGLETSVKGPGNSIENHCPHNIEHFSMLRAGIMA